MALCGWAFLFMTRFYAYSSLWSITYEVQSNEADEPLSDDSEKSHGGRPDH